MKKLVKVGDKEGQIEVFLNLQETYDYHCPSSHDTRKATRNYHLIKSSIRVGEQRWEKFKDVKVSSDAEVKKKVVELEKELVSHLKGLIDASNNKKKLENDLKDMGFS